MLPNMSGGGGGGGTVEGDDNGNASSLSSSSRGASAGTSPPDRPTGRSTGAGLCGGRGDSDGQLSDGSNESSQQHVSDGGGGDANNGGGAAGGGGGQQQEPDEETRLSDDFRMYEFKVRRCSRTRAHDWTECPFTHPGEKARRRDPRRFSYCGTACPEFRKGSCPRSDACEFAHGVFECWLHPSRWGGTFLVCVCFSRSPSHFALLWLRALLCYSRG